jgi:triacylglycerol lipase
MTPIVLQHGLFGFGEVQFGSFKLGYFHGIDRAIGERGHPVIISRVHPTGSIQRRASQLKQNILRQLDTMNREREKVVIIAHSMGGLDARYMITKLGMDDRVSALVTISTPHRGSPYADWCITHGQRLGAMKLFNFLNLDVQAVSDLTLASCARFNEQVPDAPSVRYFSISAARPWHRVAPIFYHSHQVIHPAEGDNDGLVSVRSATWAEHLGTWPADHLHVLNKRLVIELKDPTGDMTPRYLKLLDHLCELGLCNGKP